MMKTDPTRFDEMIQKFQKHYMRTNLLDALLGADAKDPDLFTKRPAEVADWKARFKTDTWDAFHALATLGLPHISTPPPGCDPDTCEGSTNTSGVWVRPDAQFAVKVAAHELAHNVLGHIAAVEANITKAQQVEDLVKTLWKGDMAAQAMALGAAQRVLDVLKSREETEAELTAFLVADALGADEGDADRLFDWTAEYLGRNMPVILVDKDKVKAAAQQILAAGMVADIRKAA